MSSILYSINLEALKDDLRKVGIGLILGGLLNSMVNTTDARSGLIMALIGSILWAIGLLNQQEAST